MYQCARLPPLFATVWAFFFATVYIFGLFFLSFFILEDPT